MSSGTNNISYNPYAILQVDPQSSHAVVKKAYRALAKVYHPDKGGNIEMFRILTKAYRSIMGETDGQTRGVRDADLEVDKKGSLNADNFTLDKFNQEFQSHSKKGVDYVYDIDYKGHNGDRKKSAYLAERNRVSDDLANMKPIFNRGMGFDPNVFNKLFERLKVEADTKQVGSGGEQGALVSSGGGNLPMALVSQSQVDFSNVNPHSNLEVSKSDLSTGDLGGFSRVGMGGRVSGDRHGVGSFQNRREGISSDEYDRLMVEGQRRAQDMMAMSKSEAKRRIGEYKSNSFHQIPTGGAKPPVGAMGDGQVGALDPYYRNSGTGLLEGRAGGAGAGGGYMITYDEGGSELGKPSMPKVTYVQTQYNNQLMPRNDTMKTVKQLSNQAQIGMSQTRNNQYRTPHPADAFNQRGGMNRGGVMMNRGGGGMMNRGGGGMMNRGGGMGRENHFMEPSRPSGSGERIRGHENPRSGGERIRGHENPRSGGERMRGHENPRSGSVVAGVDYPKFNDVMSETMDEPVRQMSGGGGVSGGSGGIDLESQSKLAAMEARLEEMTKRMKLQDKIIKKVYGRTKEYRQIN